MHWRWISLAALLAAFAIGYGAFNERRTAPRLSEGPPVQPGYYLRDAVITQTQADGSLGVRLIARSVEQPSEDASITIDDVRMNYFQATGREWLLTADRAFAPAASSIVTFRGDVLLRPVDAENAALRTEALAIDTDKNIAYGVDSPSTLQFGSHSMLVKNFTADLSSEKLRLESVDGRFEGE